MCWLGSSRSRGHGTDPPKSRWGRAVCGHQPSKTGRGFLRAQEPTLHLPTAPHLGFSTPPDPPSLSAGLWTVPAGTV